VTPVHRAIGIAAAAAIVVLAVVVLTGGRGSSAANQDTAAQIVDAAELRALAGSLGHPIYWAGPLPGEQLEVTEASNGDVYLRYLPDGVEAGDRHSSFLTIGTYPVGGGEQALSAAAAESGSKLRRSGDALVLVGPRDPTSAYLAYTGSDFEIEIYDPVPGAASGLAASGTLRPAG
jgi:hypothetical protein